MSERAQAPARPSRPAPSARWSLRRLQWKAEPAPEQIVSRGAFRRHSAPRSMTNGSRAGALRGHCERLPGMALAFGVTVLPDPPWQRLVELIQLAERHGFEYGWTYDSHVLWQESTATLTLAAAATESI